MLINGVKKFMTARWRELLKDILYGAVVPLIVGFIIIAFPLSQPLLRQINPALIGILVFGLEEQILIVAVPMLFGLLWNQWAGGASGFLLGSNYALWYAIYGGRTPGRILRERNANRLHRWSIKQAFLYLLQNAILRDCCRSYWRFISVGTPSAL